MRALGKKVPYEYGGADAKLLEAFPNPFYKGMSQGKILITAPEFTSLCPITGQPDFATIEIEYTPHHLCVESKSLKLYLGSFRQAAMFHETCTKKICDDLATLLKPKFITVVGKFSPRGGISFWPTASWVLPLSDLNVTGTITGRWSSKTSNIKESKTSLSKFPSRAAIHGKKIPYGLR